MAPRRVPNPDQDRWWDETVSPPAEYGRGIGRTIQIASAAWFGLSVAIMLLSHAWVSGPLGDWSFALAAPLALGPVIMVALRERRKTLQWLRSAQLPDLPAVCDALALSGPIRHAAAARLQDLIGEIGKEHITSLSEERARALFGAMRWPEKKLCWELIRLSDETGDAAALPALMDLAWIAEPNTELKAAAQGAYRALAHADREKAPARSLLRPASAADAAQQILVRPACEAGEPSRTLLRPADEEPEEQTATGG